MERHTIQTTKRARSVTCTTRCSQSIHPVRELHCTAAKRTAITFYRNNYNIIITRNDCESRKQRLDNSGFEDHPHVQVSTITSPLFFNYCLITS